MKKVIAAISLPALFIPLFSMAHPGHGETDGFSVIHYFVEPVHVVISLSVLIVGFLYIRYLWRNRQPGENR